MRASNRTMRLILPLAGVLTAMGGSTAASAQTRADTASVVRATVGVIGDSILPRMSQDREPLLGEPTAPFDGWVTRDLQDRHHLMLMPTEADTAEWVVTRGFVVRGDTAEVLIETGTRMRPSFLDTCIEIDRYFFVRAAGGWGFVRRVFVSVADLGAVRG